MRENARFAIANDHFVDLIDDFFILYLSDHLDVFLLFVANLSMTTRLIILDYAVDRDKSIENL